MISHMFYVALATLFIIVFTPCEPAGAQGLGSTKNINVLRPDGVPGKSAISGVVADPDGDDEISNAERAEERRQRREARQQRREQERAERQRRREARQQREEERVEQRRQRREARRQRQREQEEGGGAVRQPGQKNINAVRPDSAPVKSVIPGIVADPGGAGEISDAERAEERRQRREARRQREEERAEQRRQRREARRQRQQQQQQQEESEDDGSQQGGGKKRGPDQLQVPARSGDCLPPKICLDDGAVRPRFNP